MANISDIIEKFILESLVDDSSNISRNDLASYFGVAPSQINYVLSTRFTYARGFGTESRRGGGGYVRIYRIKENKDSYVDNVIKAYLNDKVSFVDSVHILENLENKLIISAREKDIIKSAISPKSLKTPIDMEDRIRANVLKNLLITLL